MKSYNFKNAVNDLCEHFQTYKKPTEQTIYNWLKLVKFIPDEAVDYIITKIKDDKDSMPRNLTKAFKEYWRMFLFDNPDKLAKHQRTPCSECGGEGLIFYTEHDMGQIYNGAAVCPRCENWQQHFGSVESHQKLSIADLKKRGAQVLKPIPISDIPF